MNAIFLTNGADAVINRVYGAETQAKIRKETALAPEVFTRDTLPKNDLRDTGVIFSTWGMPDLSGAEIGKYFPVLKAVFYAAGSVQSFARPFLRRGVRVFSAWGANAVPVAEYTTAQIILANKGYFQSAALVKSKGYDTARACAQDFPGNFDVKVGLIGCGMIGGLVARMLQAYRLEVLAFDPFLSDARAGELGVTKRPLDALFAECQTISNHLANNEKTRGLLDYSLFRLMKPGAAFINTGRGAQVVESDLIRALKEEPRRTALLDVTDPEPPRAGSELYTLGNVTLTPHIAGSMGGEVARMGEYMAAEFEAWRQGRAVKFEVTEGLLETMA